MLDERCAGLIPVWPRFFARRGARGCRSAYLKEIGHAWPISEDVTVSESAEHPVQLFDHLVVVAVDRRPQVPQARISFGR
jgi:hypothetical protein